MLSGNAATLSHISDEKYESIVALLVLVLSCLQKVVRKLDIADAYF